MKTGRPVSDPGEAATPAAPETWSSQVCKQLGFPPTFFFFFQNLHYGADFFIFIFFTFTLLKLLIDSPITEN